MKRALAVAVLLFLTGCNNASELKKTLGFVLSDARALVIGPRNASTRGALQQSGAMNSVPNALYSLGADGALTVVTVTDDPNESSSSTVQPFAAFDTLKYAAFLYEGVNDGKGQECGMILARKSDGALFCVSKVRERACCFAGDDGTGPAKARYVQSDASGDLLWAAGNTVERIDFTDPANPVSSQPIDGTKRASDFAVNADGDALFIWTANGPAEQSPVRIQKANGGFQNLSTAGGVCPISGFAANPKDFYYLDSRNNPNGPPNEVWTKWTGGATTFTKTDVAVIPGVPGGQSRPPSCQPGLVKTADAAWIVGGTTLLKLTDDSATQIAIPTLASVNHISGTGAAIYLLGTDSAGNGGILRFDPATSAFTTLLPPGDYLVSAMEVTGAGDVTFQGQRASDGAGILGVIPAGTTSVSVLSSSFPSVTAIVRLN